MTATNTDWLTPGATVAEYSSSNWAAHATFTTIEKLTATQVVCANGHRYRRDDNAAYAETRGLRQVGDGRNYLLPPDHRDVLNAVADRELSALRGTVDRLFRDTDRGVSGALATLSAVAEAVAAARATIERNQP